MLNDVWRFVLLSDLCCLMLIKPGVLYFNMAWCVMGMVGLVKQPGVLYFNMAWCVMGMVGLVNPFHGWEILTQGGLVYPKNLHFLASCIF